MTEREKIDVQNKEDNPTSSKKHQIVGPVGLNVVKPSFSHVENMISKVKRFDKIISEQIKLFMNVSAKVVTFVQSINWDLVEQRWLQLAEKTGGNGWTISLAMDLDMLFSMIEIQSREEIDQVFINFFEEQENYLLMKTDILANESLADFEKLLIQCFDSYERGHFLIAIPSLFSIIEGYANQLIIDQYKKTADFNPKNRVSLPNKYKKVQEQSESSFKDVVYISALIFLEKSFNTKAFNDDPEKDNRPLIINRHRVLHGRDNPSLWTKTDALRLFNAIGTLSILDIPK